MYPTTHSSYYQTTQPEFATLPSVGSNEQTTNPSSYRASTASSSFDFIPVGNSNSIYDPTIRSSTYYAGAAPSASVQTTTTPQPRASYQQPQVIPQHYSPQTAHTSYHPQTTTTQQIYAPQTSYQQQSTYQDSSPGVSYQQPASYQQSTYHPDPSPRASFQQSSYQQTSNCGSFAELPLVSTTTTGYPTPSTTSTMTAPTSAVRQRSHTTADYRGSIPVNMSYENIPQVPSAHPGLPQQQRHQLYPSASLTAMDLPQSYKPLPSVPNTPASKLALPPRPNRSSSFSHEETTSTPPRTPTHFPTSSPSPSPSYHSPPSFVYPSPAASPSPSYHSSPTSFQLPPPETTHHQTESQPSYGSNIMVSSNPHHQPSTGIYPSLQLSGNLQYTHPLSGASAHAPTTTLAPPSTATTSTIVASLPIPPSAVNVIVFVNSKSGGQQGAGILEKFKAALPEDQVFDLSNGGPEPGLQHWKSSSGLRILVCGGDGTAGWVMATFDKMLLPKPYPPVAVLPLGTGNDLARTLGWGGGYKGESSDTVLKKLEASVPLPMDRWKVVTEARPGEAAVITPTTPPPAPNKNLVMNNYLSIGLDAKIALEFHTMREKNPHYFKSQFVNKAWYANYGLKNIVSSIELSKIVKLEIDNAVYVFPDAIQGIIILNVPSYAGGAKLWDQDKDSKFSNPTISDELLEVVGINSTTHLGQIQMKIAKATKIGQGRSIRITHTTEMPMQVDGEPWIAQPGVITVTHLNQSTMLSYLKPKKKLLGSLPFGGAKKEKKKEPTP